jgi:hypothetical protein
MFHLPQIPFLKKLLQLFTISLKMKQMPVFPQLKPVFQYSSIPVFPQLKLSQLPLFSLPTQLPLQIKS